MIYQERSDNRGPGRPPKYPLRELAIGESVFFPGSETELVGKRARTYKPLKFKCRTVVSGGIKGTRVWRIA